MNYSDKLLKAVREAGSVLCVGLDPNLDRIPQPVKDRFEDPAEQVTFFCKMVVDYTAEHCAAFKPNLAFFEALGPKGLQVFEEVINHIPKDKIVIADAKRGDISSTAEHYYKAYFETFNVDALTLNPLMGFETLDAFKDHPEKALYVLALTSNPGAADFLKKSFEGYDMMGQYIAAGLAEWSSEEQTHLGMVIGATQTDIAESVLKHHKNGALLIPGIGAQGGSVDDTRKALTNHEGIALINSSRGIIYAGGDHENWADLVAGKARETQKLLSSITELYV
ncbi:orotidine-5'-phosphate decarboxylase [Balneola sp. MJW-20]|uniref:orotidine-5'-phosphate decarboxylase n=1 Tax=Gracilimonas aurantiaca TaxID=3234185 RepID=UPI003465EED2